MNVDLSSEFGIFCAAKELGHKNFKIALEGLLAGHAQVDILLHPYRKRRRWLSQRPRRRKEGRF